MIRSILPRKFFLFLSYVLVTIFVTYYLPAILSNVWYVFLLIRYYASKDEPFWLAFFLVTVDGFFGFLGLYSCLITIVPGLPGIEIAQFYIMLSFLKAFRKKTDYQLYYKNYLNLLFVYTIFMIVWGQVFSFTIEIGFLFSTFKMVIPFLLFYTIPRLFTSIDDFQRFFGFVFPVLLGAFMAQLFNLTTGFTPAGRLMLEEQYFSEAGAFRGFYNPAALLSGLFGALFFISKRGTPTFNRLYLSIVIVTAIGLALLSATRGWMIAVGVVVGLSLGLNPGISNKIRVGFAIFILVAFSFAMSIETVRTQVLFSIERFETLEDLAEGDITAGGTLKRLDVRGPRVMNVWRDNPVFGWGYSTVAWEHMDGHVGNQTLLMMSGVVGFSLLVGFILFVSVRMLFAYKNALKKFVWQNSLLVTSIFPLGWFILHSTSGMQFGYGGLPGHIIPQAVFLSFGGLMYHLSRSYSKD